MYKNNGKISLKSKVVLVCSADYPADNHSRQLAQFYIGLYVQPKKQQINK